MGTITSIFPILHMMKLGTVTVYATPDKLSNLNKHRPSG